MYSQYFKRSRSLHHLQSLLAYRCKEFDALMQRSTFSIEDDVMRKIRKRASRERRTIGSVVNSLLRKALKLSSQSEPRDPVNWKTHSVGEVFADVNDRDALEAAMKDQ